MSCTLAFAICMEESIKGEGKKEIGFDHLIKKILCTEKKLNIKKEILIVFVGGGSLSPKSKVKGFNLDPNLFSIYLKYSLAKASTNFKSFQSRTPAVPPHDPHIVTDFSHDNGLYIWVCCRLLLSSPCRPIYS